MPTDEEWVEDPKGSALRMMDIRDAEKEKRDTDSRTQADEKLRNDKDDADYKTALGEGWGEMTKQYPQLVLKDGTNNTEDRLFCEAAKILAEGPMLAASGGCDKFVVELAARRLGIQPISAGKSGKEKKKDYLIGGSGAGGKGSGSDGQVTDEEFLSWSSEKRAEYVKSQSR
jgi:hypothetical protein